MPMGMEKSSSKYIGECRKHPPTRENLKPYRSSWQSFCDNV